MIRWLMLGSKMVISPHLTNKLFKIFKLVTDVTYSYTSGTVIVTVHLNESGLKFFDDQISFGWELKTPTLITNIYRWSDAFCEFVI